MYQSFKKNKSDSAPWDSRQLTKTGLYSCPKYTALFRDSMTLAIMFDSQNHCGQLPAVVLQFDFVSSLKYPVIFYSHHVQKSTFNCH